jgi:hypothetical protein
LGSRIKRFEKAELVRVHETAREKLKGKKDRLVDASRSEGSTVNEDQGEERL